MKSVKLSASRPRRSLGRLGYATVAIAALALAGCGTTSASGTPAATTHVTSATADSHPAAGSGVPANFQVLSMTFVSDQQGFALGNVKCGTGRCAAVLGTTDGGTKWRRLTAPTRRLGGIYNTCPGHQPCVSQLRFATPLIGYAFDPSLFLTTDGGSHWRHVAGPNVSSLEAADGTAVRVASKGEGCSGMPYQVQQATVGTTTWRTLPAPRILMICPPVLYRQGTRLTLVGYGNPAGGVRATAQIARSTNNGANWQIGPDQCGGKDGYASAVALAPPNALILLCRHQMASGPSDFGTAWVRVSPNDGTSFGPDRIVPAPAGIPANQTFGYQLAAASPSLLLVVVHGQHGYRVMLSTNGGRTWRTTLTPNGQGSVLLVGYEDPQTARIAQGDLVWTTRDGGQHWTENQFSS